jgi:HK97 family phage portal protein
MNRTDFIEATAGFAKLKGQAFWILDDEWFTPRAKKSPLILARPDEMHAIYDGHELLGWSWLNASGKRSSLIPEQVIHIKCWNPYDDVLGLSDWESAMIAAESDYAAGTFAKNLAQNNGDRGPYVIGKGGVFTDEQIKQVSAQLRMKRELGRGGEFRASFIPADVEIKEPSINAVDAAYVAQRLENRKEVYAAFGVPPSFADAQASYSIGSASDRFRLIEDTCMPLAAKIADALEIVCTRFLGKKQTLFVCFDWDSHSTMQAVRAERFETATKAVDRGMPWQAASEYFQLKMPRFKGDDVGRVPFNLQEIGDSGSEMVDAPAGEEEEIEDPVAELEQLFARRPASPTGYAGASLQKACGCGAKGKAAGDEWKQIYKAREPWVKRYESKIRRHVMDARGETLRNISRIAEMEGKGVVQKWNVLDLIFDLASWLPDWTKALSLLSRSSLESAGFEVWKDELDRDDVLTMPAAEVIQATRDREPVIAKAGEKIHADIRKEIEQAIEDGDTMEEIAKRVKSKFAGISDTRAMTIARTEVTYSYETGRDISFRAAGVQWTKWVTVNDGEDRHPSYSGLHNQVRPIDEPFTIYGSVTMRYPGDPEGPPSEIINCRCVRVAVLGPDPSGANNDDTVPY